MKTVIVGGGRAGRELAARVPGSVVIIEIDEEKCKKLAGLNNVEVVSGDGSDVEVLNRVGLDDVGAFISLTSDDEVNYRAAVIAKMHGVPRIMVRVENPEEKARFEDLGVEYITSPPTVVANLIAGLIQSPKSELGAPFNRIMVPIITEHTVNRAFKEALLIASVARAEVTAVLSTGMKREELESAAMELGVRLRIIVEREKLMSIVKKHLHYPGCIILERVREHLYCPDCIIIDQEELGFLDRFMGRSIVLRSIKYAGCPVLVARTFRYYEHVLAILDSSEAAQTVGMYSVQMAHLCRAELHLLILEDIRGEVLDGIKRLGDRGNVRITEKWVEGNPMIETVKEVKSGDYELAVIPWRGTGVIRADMIRKIINNAPCSVLTVV